ncbi:hypothetical protein [Sinorhizobium medicae]|uniref:hypothetical protein n=1 Tax=Sinorhizobium medicae TaxID=110321 RepID=UPI001FB3C6BE|nr:hypothetical protein [Sinorhizobium medicae]
MRLAAAVEPRLMPGMLMTLIDHHQPLGMEGFRKLVFDMALQRHIFSPIFLFCCTG